MKFVFVILTLLFLGGIGFSFYISKMKTQNFSREIAGMERKSFCLGRFLVDIPANASLASQSQTIANLKVEVEKNEPKKTVEEIIQAMTLEISKLPAPADESATIINSISLGDEAWGIVFHDSTEVLESIKLRGVRLVGDKLFRITAGAEIDQADELIRLARSIASAISLSKNPLQPTFCLQEGFLNLPFEYQESVEAAFDFEDSSKLTIETRSIGRETPVSLGAEAKETLANLGANGVKPALLRSGMRKIADMSGEELLIETADERSALFQWRFIGDPKSGERPYIQITVDANDVTNAKKLITIWDLVLDSLRRNL
ncbi:hypothetical protein HYV30_02905 [Candidatus Kaiserbacteria bacterium]|nr:hypothetical protein [Candidatus Kaiserbacteria bacterium]